LALKIANDQNGRLGCTGVQEIMLILIAIVLTF